MNGSLPSIEQLKEQAKRLRADLGSEGKLITHCESLELLAHRTGFKDWNTLRAAAGDRPPPCPVRPGARVSGRYLSQSFDGEVINVEELVPPGRFRITLQFDQPVDVVTSASFSNLRRRVSCVIGLSGVTAETTSDGRPHLQLDVQPSS